MSSLCDGADCFGIDTSLDGNTCLTNEVRCKDGVLTVISQGSRYRRFAAGAGGDYTTDPDTPLDIPIGVTTATGPSDSDGTPLLSVSFTNPFCVTASLVFHCEFAVRFGASTSDSWTVSGDATIAGATARFIETNPPYTVDTPLTNYQVEVARWIGTPIVDNDLVIDQVVHREYNLLGEVAAGETFAVDLLTVIRFLDVTGGFRSVQSFNCALSILCTAKL